MQIKKTAQQLLWFAALWTGGLLAVGMLAYGIKLFLR